jgi:RNA polymerase sigma-70 factor (ECF subfamily)
MGPIKGRREAREASAALIERARTDGAAFGEIFDLYYDDLFQFCWAYSRSPQDAEDLTAETFTKALRALQRGKGAPGGYEDRGRPFSSFLRRIATREIFTLWDRRSGHRSLSLDGVHPFGESGTSKLADLVPDPAATSPDALVEDWERGVELNAALARLPEEQRVVVQWRFLEERPFADIARDLQCSVDAAKKRCERGLAKLRELLLQRRFGSGRQLRGLVECGADPRPEAGLPLAPTAAAHTVPRTETDQAR